MTEFPRPRLGRRAATYVLDAHALYWYLHDPARLSLAAEMAIDAVVAAHALGLVPAIVVAELYYLTVKLQEPVAPRALFSALGNSGGFSFPALGRPQLELLGELTEIPEMHDRLIAAEARLRGAIVVSRDPVFQASGLVSSLW